MQRDLVVDQSLSILCLNRAGPEEEPDANEGKTISSCKEMTWCYMDTDTKGGRLARSLALREFYELSGHRGGTTPVALFTMTNTL